MDLNFRPPPSASRLLWAAFLAMGLALPSALRAQTLPVATQGAPGPTTIRSEFAGRKVEEVKIIGNATVPTLVILNCIRTTVGQPLEPATVAEDYQRIFDLKKFANVVPKIEPTATGVIVVFDMTEQKVVTAVRFRGNNRMQTATLHDAVDLQPGQSIDSFRIALAKQAIEKAYRDHNFPFAHVDVLQDQLTTEGVVTFSIVEGPRVEVRKVNFLGNHSFSDDKLLDQVKTRAYLFILRPGTFDSEQVDDDVASLRQYYEQKGFFDARVGRKIIFSADQTEVMISFVIDEGQRYIVASIKLEGFQPPRTVQTLRKGLKLIEGKPYDAEVLRRDVRQMVRTYGPGYIYLPDTDNPDYLQIKPKTVFHKEGARVDLIYEIHEGRKFYISDIRIKGNAKIQDKVFLRELWVHPGQLYNSAQLADAVDRIKALRVVSSVTITPVGDDPDFRTVLVEVGESQSAYVMVGAGFTSNSGILGQISYEQRNFDITNVPSSASELFSNRAFTGAGQFFRILLEPGTQQSRARISFQEPYLFDQPYIFGADAFYSTILREHYDEIRQGGKLTFGKRFGEHFIAQVSLRAEDVDIADIQDKPYRALEILSNSGHHSVTGAGLNLHYSDIDSPLLPTHGFTLSFGYERAGALGGEYNFDKFTADGSFFQLVNEDLLDRKTTLNERIASGYISGNAPFFERFYGGGIGYLRGFRFRGVGPVAGPDQDPIGGDFSLTGTVELNFPLVGEVVRGVTFIDAGTVEKKFEITTMRSSVGFGFRLTLPFLGQVPLALDFAVPLSKSNSDQTQFVSFSLGLAQ